VHFGNFWKNQTGGGPLFAATQRCFNTIHLAAASPCRCLACMPRCFNIFPPPNLIFLLLIASSHFSSPPARQAGRAKLLLLLLQLALLCCAVVPLFASCQCCCFATCLLLPPASRSRPCHSKPQPRSSANAGRAMPSAPALTAPFFVESRQSAAVILRARAPQCHLLPPLERATLVTVRRPPLGLLLS
jgi:hypothetical protein